MKTDTPQTIYLKDYTPPAYHVRHVDMVFQIFDGRTRVTTTTQFEKNTGGDLFLNGQDVTFISGTLDGAPLNAQITDTGMTIANPGKDRFTLEIITDIAPETNTALEGLYQSGGTYCTQCEAEGFRKITYYQDRPDVMATFRVRVEADKKSCPVLLSNGNLVEKGDLPDGRHFTVWDDPTPKSCYLFALVAGDLVHIHDIFTTRSGNKVDLYIYVRKGDETQCAHAMTSLIKSMKWDEDVYGREYQYNIFNIVAVSDFNMGAMENTSLNIFNTALVLAHPETATDGDFMRVESVIAHEYFHNWTGNRVTCRDWFQLSLKEGLTVFRDQEFSADMNSRAVQRIDDVAHLRRAQFPEDASPLAHPIRPDNYIEINNFYTMTVYEKGAEIIRMFHTLLGAENYRKATDLYFERFDGMAVTTDDWWQCMQDASDVDLTQFKLWYSQAGTPEVKAVTRYNASSKKFMITLSQTIPDTPGQKNKKPMHIPVSVGLIGPNGDDLIGTQTLHLTETEQTFTFFDIGVAPVASILRNFSAPVKLTTNLEALDLLHLAIHDTDAFNRWEAGQTILIRDFNASMDNEGHEIGTATLQYFENTLRQALQNEGDKALLAKALQFPDVNIVAQTRGVVEPDLIYNTITTARIELCRDFYDDLLQIYHDNKESGAFSITPESMGRRALKNAVLALLDDPELAFEQYQSANNMTDRVAALSVLADKYSSQYLSRQGPPVADESKVAAFADFYDRFKTHPLVIDKWFSLQASAVHRTVADEIRALANHPDFNLKNPNRVRSLYGAFANNNPVQFHAVDGSGYILLKDCVAALNEINPQIAARLVTPLREWRRYTRDRQIRMKATLEEIANLPNLSPNVFEIVTKSLNG